jgi:hypothetical protein
MKRLRLFALVCTSATLFFMMGCSISTSHGDKNNGDANKDVDIRTPFGSLSVHGGNPDPKETGLSVYPGAQVKVARDKDGDSGANVNISSSLFGMKLAVLKYQTSDPPDKVVSFYRKDLARYGKVIDCNGGFTMNFHHHDQDAEVTCGSRDTDHEYRQELKVGTENNQRIVAVKPSGNGTEFVMVYVRAHGDKDTM